jgi:hypothetical protein
MQVEAAASSAYSSPLFRAASVGGSFCTGSPGHRRAEAMPSLGRLCRTTKVMIVRPRELDSAWRVGRAKRNPPSRGAMGFAKSSTHPTRVIPLENCHRHLALSRKPDRLDRRKNLAVPIGPSIFCWSESSRGIEKISDVGLRHNRLAEPG